MAGGSGGGGGNGSSPITITPGGAGDTPDVQLPIKVKMEELVVN